MIRKRLLALAGALATAAAISSCDIVNEPITPPPTGFVEEITSDNFEEKVLNSQLPVSLEFGSEICTSCYDLRQALSYLAPEFEGRLVIGSFAVENDKKGIFDKYVDKSSLPVLGCFYNGEAMPYSYFMVGYDPSSGGDEDLRAYVEQCAALGE